MGGRLAGEARVLAGSKGARPDLAAEAIRDAALPAPDGQPIGTLALVRGRTSPFLFVQSMMISGAALPVRHYHLMPPDGLRSLGGNLRGLLGLALPQFPTYEMTGQTLPPVILHPAPAMTPEQQEQAMLNLMTITRDSFAAIETMLAAIIQGVPIIIQGAPTELPKRIALIEGLLSLLPPPARYGVTFATYSFSETTLDAQIRFIADDVTLPPDVLGYTWGEPKTAGRKPEDDYARFIKSQLRLDTSLVSERTRALTPIAGWRLRRGDSMTDALAYGSYRLKMDQALLNSQPVGAPEAAKVLAEDPTLTDELRVIYIRHLLAFALVLDDDENTDLLTVVAKGQPELERAILDEMRGALITGKGDRVYRRVSRWLGGQGGFKGMYWMDLLHRATIANAETLAKAGDTDGLNRFLLDIRAAPNASDFVPALPRLIEISLPLAGKHKELAETIFVLSATALPAEQLQRVAAVKPLMAQLPPSLTLLFNHLAGLEQTAPLDGLVAQAASDFSPQWRPLIAIRLTELIILAGRYDLLDSATMDALAQAAMSDTGVTYDDTLRWIARSLSSDDTVQILDSKGRVSLLKILLARRAYTELATELQRHQRLFFTGEKQMQFAAMTQRVFGETDLPADDMGEALVEMGERGLKPLPLTLAYFGALRQRNWPPEMYTRVAELTTLVFGNRLIAETLSPDMLAELLNYHVERRDQSQALRVVSLLPATAARKGDEGIAVMVNMYNALDWNTEVQAAALEGLRRYIRRLPDAQTDSTIVKLGNELGEPIQLSLEATEMMFQLMGGEMMGDYAYTLHTAAQFLYDTGLTYIDKNRAPSMNSLLSDLDSLSGGLNNDERRALSESMFQLGRNLIGLATQHRAVHPRENVEQIEQLLTGKGSASSVLDVFRVMGGYFARGKRLSVRTDKLAHSHPLADRAAHNLLRELEQINRLLEAAIKAMPADRKFSMTATAIQGEIESLWGDLSLNERRNLVRYLAIDLQRIPEIALIITEKYDPKVIQDDSGLGKKLDNNRQRPENALEFYRFVHGYFAGRVR